MSVAQAFFFFFGSGRRKRYFTETFKSDGNNFLLLSFPWALLPTSLSPNRGDQYVSSVAEEGS